MSSSNVINDAARYLEFFLKGLSDSGIIGSYTVQFLEIQQFGSRLQDALVTHFIHLIENIKHLLVKLALPYGVDVSVQTEPCSICSLCGGKKIIQPNSKTSVSAPPKKEVLSTIGHEKSLNRSLLSNVVPSGSLISIKPETMGGSLSAFSGTVITDISPEFIENQVDFASLQGKGALKLHSDAVQEESITEKAVVGVQHIDDQIECQYRSQAEIAAASEGSVLLSELETSHSVGFDSMMYAVYTLNSGASSLQPVSSQVNKLLDRGCSHESAEPGVIKIHTSEEVRDDFLEVDQSLHKNMDNVSPQDSVKKEELVIAPDITIFDGSCVEDGRVLEHKVFRVTAVDSLESRQSKQEDLPAVEAQIETLEESLDPAVKERKVLKATVTHYGSSSKTIITNIMKLGVEDLHRQTWCSLCEKEFPSSTSLKIHLSRSHRHTLWCHTCGKTVKSKEEMRYHIKDCHSDLPFLCIICGTSLKSNAALQRHMDIHKGLRGSACEICGQTFSRSEYHREHRRIHTGERPYECSECKKSFSKSSNLKAHLLTHRSSEEKHLCTICSKPFARSDKLKEHIIRHLRIKRFNCKLCQKTYSEKRDLVKHLKKVHRSQTEETSCA